MSPDVYTPDSLSLAAHGARPRSGGGTRIPPCAEGAARRRGEPIQMGNITIAADACRHMLSFLRLERVLRDIRYATRIFRRTPGFTAIAVPLASRRNRRERRHVHPGEHASGSPAAVSPDDGGRRRQPRLRIRPYRTGVKPSASSAAPL